MLRSIILAGAVLFATSVAAEPFTAPVAGSYTQNFGGFGTDGTEDLFEIAVPPLDVSPGTDFVRIAFEGTLTQSLSFTFQGSEFGDESFCTSTAGSPSFGLLLLGAELANLSVANGVSLCGDIGEDATDTQSAPVLFSAEIDRTDPLFEFLSEGVPLELVFRDPNTWDLERTTFDSFVYVTGFDGNIFVEAVDGTPNEVPEPAALGLLGLGALALGLRRRAVRARSSH